MKRRLELLKGSLVLLLMAVCCSCMFSSCDEFKSKKSSKTEVKDDSTVIANYIEATTNPTFFNADEAILYQEKFINNSEVDNTFMSMSTAVINDVVKVLLKNGSTAVTKKDVVEEYLKNRRIYDKLAEENVEENTETTLNSNVENGSSGGISYRYETDTINGKIVKVKVKEERTYEE